MTRKIDYLIILNNEGLDYLAKGNNTKARRWGMAPHLRRGQMEKKENLIFPIFLFIRVYISYF
jgi:hypothetical protein